MSRAARRREDSADDETDRSRRQRNAAVTPARWPPIVGREGNGVGAMGRRADDVVVLRHRFVGQVDDDDVVVDQFDGHQRRPQSPADCPVPDLFAAVRAIPVR